MIVLIPSDERPAVANTGIPGSAERAVAVERPARATAQSSPVREALLPAPEPLDAQSSATTSMGAPGNGSANPAPRRRPY